MDPLITTAARALANARQRNLFFSLIVPSVRRLKLNQCRGGPIAPSLEFEITCHVSTLASLFNVDFTTPLGW